MKKNIRKKDIRKIIRGTLQGIIVLLLVFLLLRAFLSTNVYTPYEDTNMQTKDTGFVALSYFGVSRIGDDVTITTKRFEEHIKALKENGYVTITQQDILDYYLKGKKLPDKSLFLMFEDGYAGTAIFAGKVMEKYNLKATMLTYGDKLAIKDPKFLTPKDLKQLEKETYWEIGTNGYRLSYINVFDKEDKYLGELSSYEFIKVRKELNRKYNQYLMDYIRDEYGVPKETYQQMKNRIKTDYQLLERSYEEGINYVPKLHVLMHANTERYGNNQRVSDVNEEMIKEMFSMNFNREGFSVNNQECNLYDLTRMQPQAYWSPNHLLMRIWDDTKQDVNFEVGDKKESKQFETIKGATQFAEESIVITSLPSDAGLIRLKNSENFQDVQLDVTVSGNVLGGQGIYLRADEALQNYVKVQIINNELRIIECVEGTEFIMKSVDLECLDDIDTSNIQLFTTAKRQLMIKLNGNSITVLVNGKDFSPADTLHQVKPGSLFLESMCNEEAYSQRNLYDDVYDGVFEQIVVATSDSKKILYDNQLHGLDKVQNRIEKTWSNIVNWFVENL
ncbi:MAG: polysaccharide deacetylase family protein [Clostridiales bacterium]|nr:polysaccharide deacetylase family protein [Clostridiales bacterium]